MSKTRHPEVWKAIQVYVEACGGDSLLAARQRGPARDAAWALDKVLDEAYEIASQDIFLRAVEETE